MGRMSSVLTAMLLGILFTTAAWAYPGGITGTTNKSGGAGCGGCHAGNSLSMVTISGPAALKVGQAGTYTLTINSGTLIGCDIAASSGTLAVVTANTKLTSSEVTHSKALSGSTVQFKYTPTATGAMKLYAAGAKNSRNGGWGHAPDFTVTVTASGTADVAETGVPGAYVLHQNYPNPFNPTTVIRYDLPQEGNVRLTVFNLIGEEVATLVYGTRAAGSHSVRFNGKGLPSGAYIYRLNVRPSSGSAPFVATRKFVLTR